MKRRHLHRWTFWLLPLLVARALVPMGFMLSADADGLSIVICSGTTVPPAPTTHDSAHHHHHGSEDGASTDEQSAQQSSLCAFALSGAASNYEVATFEEMPSHAAYSLPSELLLVPAAGPLRTHSIRGPPVLI
jgi:hypothetical protein